MQPSGPSSCRSSIFVGPSARADRRGDLPGRLLCETMLSATLLDSVRELLGGPFEEPLAEVDRGANQLAAPEVEHLEQGVQFAGRREPGAMRQELVAKQGQVMIVTQKLAEHVEIVGELIQRGRVKPAEQPHLLGQLFR